MGTREVKFEVLNCKGMKVMELGDSPKLQGIPPSVHLEATTTTCDTSDVDAPNSGPAGLTLVS